MHPSAPSLAGPPVSGPLSMSGPLSVPGPLSVSSAMNIPGPAGLPGPLMSMSFPGMRPPPPGEPLHLHPAFLHPSYLYPGPLLAMRHQLLQDKGKSFTIDAILGPGREGSGGREGPGGRAADSPQDLRVRRESGADRGERTHPYTHLTCPTALRYSHLHGTAGKERMPDRKSNGTGWKQSKSKRVRTIFTPEQLERMEAEFERQQYMVGTERYYLAASLNLTEAQVKVWFQNRRIKWRKQNLEQQHAKLAKLELYDPDGNRPSDAESDNSACAIAEGANENSRETTRSEDSLDLNHSLDMNNIEQNGDSNMSHDSFGELEICEQNQDNDVILCRDDVTGHCVGRERAGSLTTGHMGYNPYNASLPMDASLPMPSLQPEAL